MTEFLAFAVFLAFGVLSLVVWPVCMHPGLPMKKKLIICITAFIVIVPAGAALYATLGVPQMAVN